MMNETVQQAATPIPDGENGAAQTSSAPPGARTQPIDPHTQACAAGNGDPLEWSAETWRTYLDLGGAT
ncbi:hypothetical protein [Streptomyces sp. NPDC001492]